MDEPSSAGANMAAEPGGFPRSTLVISVAIAALVVIALVVALVLPDTPATYPAGSPEAAFQDFYAAWESGDLDTAYAGLSTAVAADLDRTEYRRLDAEQRWQRDQDRRLVLLGVDVDGERAVLRLRVDSFSGGGLSGDRYSEERSIRLVREAGAWRIDEPLVGIESVAYAY